MANQITIDIGAAANDGTGDPLRTAFNYVNNNFSNVWNTGLPNSNIQFSDNRILTVNTNANLVLAPNGIGKVASNVDIVPNTANVFSLGGTTRRWNTVYTQYLDVSNYISGTLGNITVAVANLHITGGSNGYVLQTDGAGNLTWTAQTGGSGNGTPGGANTQVQYNNAGSFGGSASFTFDRTSNVLTVSGNISANNASINNLTSSNLVNARTGTFTGDQFSDGAMYIGSSSGTVLGSDVVIQITANSGSYSQTNFQNINSGARASSDYILTADNGNDATHFLDVGITSSGWDGSETNALAGLAANNGYLYVQDGNLTIGARAGNVSRAWNFDTTGLLTVPGNIIPAGNATQSLGNATRQWKDLWVSNNTIYINSVPLSVTAGNVLTFNGQDVVTTNANGTVDLANLAVDNNNIYNTTGQGVIISNFNYVTAEAETAYVQIPAGNSTDDLNVVQEQGNVRLVANTAVWNFGSTGTLTFPSLANISDGNFNAGTASATVALNAFSPDGNTVSIQAQGNSSSAVISVFANAGPTTHTWTFDSAGTLTFPNNGNILSVGDTTAINSTTTANGVIAINARESTFGDWVSQVYLDGTDRLARIGTYNPDTEIGYDWTFDAGGSLTIPTAPGNIYMGTNTNGPFISPTSLGITLNANRADETQDYIQVSKDGINLFSVNTINIENNTTGFLSTDININSGDDIFLRGRAKPDDSESEGGDINIYAGAGANAVTGGFDTSSGGDIQISGGLGGSDTGGGFGGSGGGTINISSGDGGAGSDTTNAGSGGSLSLSAGDAAGVANTALGGIGGSISISAGDTTRINEIGGTISLNTGAASGDGTSAAGYLEINIPSSNVGPGGTWVFGGTGTTLNVPGNAEIYGANFGNLTVGCAGNTIITSSDYGANVKNWTFGYTGILSLPGITTATGAEAMTVAGTRTLVGGFDNPNGAYAATFTGSSPVEVYSCDPVTQSAKFTFAIQTNNATFGWEQFDVAVIKLFAGGVGVTVSNRMNNNPDNGNTQVTANLGEGNQIVISLTQPGSGTAYVNYTATEFKLTID